MSRERKADGPIFFLWEGLRNSDKETAQLAHFDGKHTGIYVALQSWSGQTRPSDNIGMPEIPNHFQYP